MNRTSTRRHKPRTSDQTLDSQDSRWDDSKEGSDESSDDDDEDEDEDHSTDRDTEESEDESAGNRREWEALARYLKSQKAYLERNPPDSFHKMPGAKKETKDKMTQKNLTSPMPSMWKPPVYKEISGAPNFRVIKAKEVKEKESEFEDIMLRYITKLQATNNAYRNEYGKKSCPHKTTATERIKKLCSKHKKQMEHRPKRGRRDDVHACIDLALSQMGGYKRYPERMKYEDRDLKMHSRCGVPIRCHRDCLNKESGETAKLREKLVYVVEEEGKGVAKMETDLFSVNEILAIKQDLMELSEFAKKLKRLKEMKSESEKEKSSGTECQCKPLTELLRDVNKRMEALEARQEELERGIQKTRELETDTKKTDETKTLSVPPPLGPVKPEPSAVKSVSSFGKSEMSREGGGALSKNLEIVNELLDIKSQLQRLERKRMSKELSPEIGPAGSSKTKQKDQAINVFSSKTYILTTDAYNKKKTNKENHLEEKSPNSAPLTKEKTTAGVEGQPVNDIVTDWLKNISAPEKPNSNLKMYTAPNNLVRNESKREDSWRASFFKEKNRGRILEREDFGNQEPQKNRAKDTGRHETNQTGPKWSREIPTYENRKESPLASEEFNCRNKPKLRISRDNTLDKFPAELFPPELKKTLTKPLKIASSSSVPSVFVVREQIQRRKQLGKFSKEAPPVKPSRSKSVQEFTSASTLSKDEKRVLNMSRKNMEAKCARKRDKENENELVQGELNKFLKQRQGIIPIHSELVASVNLDEGSTSLRNDRSRSPKCPLPLFPFPLLSPEILKILEYCEEEEKRDNRENWCRRENWNHKPKKEDKETDKIEACVKKCYKKKTRVKCSRNHCCNKKARRAASRSSHTCRHKDSTGSCDSRRCHKKESKKCQCERRKHSKKKHRAKKTCSSDSVSSVKREECKAVEKPCHGKTVKSKQPCCEKYEESHTSCESSKTEEERKCQKKEELPTSDTSEPCEGQVRGKSKKSSLRNRNYCRTERPGRPIYDDSCYIASFWKNLRKLYPRFSALQLMSWLRLYCQEEKKTKQKYQKKQKDETPICKPPREKQKKHECPDCQCCKSVYRMSTVHQKWPGVTTSSKISEDSITEAETRSSNTTTETDFMFPYRKSDHIYAYKATAEDDDHEERKKKKKKKSKSRKKKKNTSNDEEVDIGEKKCRCERCGNIHKRKNKKVKYDQSESKPNSEEEYEPVNEDKSSKKPRKSILSKLQDVRHLRVCEGKMKCPKLKFSKSKTDCGCLSTGSKCVCGTGRSKKWIGNKKEGKCNCESKLLELEDRINNLESGKKKKHKKHEPEEDTNHKEENESGEKKKKKKKKKKRKEEDHECSGEECEHTNGCTNESCRCEVVEKKKKRKKKCSNENCNCEEVPHKKKKKKKKEKEEEDESQRCPCYFEGKKKKRKSKKSESNEDGEEVEAHYCKCLSRGFKTDERSVGPTETTTTEAPTVAPTPSEKSSFRQSFQKKKKELLERLSSLSTFWKNFRTRKKPQDEDFLLDDPSRSSAVPHRRSIQPINEEPNIIKKLKKSKKQKKDKEKKEKHKEGRVRKSKSRARRHRFG